MKSIDGGTTWISLPLSIFEYGSLLIISTKSGQLHVLNFIDFEQPSTYTSNDEGQNWTQNTMPIVSYSGGRGEVVPVPNTENQFYVYRMYEASSTNLYFYDGFAWHNKTLPLRHLFIYSLSVSADKKIFICLGSLSSDDYSCHVSQDEAETWVNMNTESYIGIFAHPTLAHVVYATEPGKIYKSTDGANTWTLVTEQVKHIESLSPPYFGIDASGKFYAQGSFDSYTMNPADNNGWQATDFMPIIHPGNGVIYRLDGTGKLYQSTNNGMAWSFVGDTGMGTNHDTEIKIHPTVSNVFYGVVRHGCDFTLCGPTSDLYISQDSGATWTLQSSPPHVIKWIIDPSSAATLYIQTNTSVFGDLDSQSFAKSTDYGATWVTREKTDELLAGTEASWFDVNDAINTNSGLLAAVPQGIFQSTNNGQSWQTFSSLPIIEPITKKPIEIMRLSSAPNEPNVFYAATRNQGLFVYGKNSPPNINSVEPHDNQFVHPNQLTTLDVFGNYLTNTTLSLELQNCANMTAQGGDSVTQSFECLMGDVALGERTGQVLDSNGAVLHDFSVTVMPQVTELLPASVLPDETVTFTISGAALPDDMAFELADCRNVQLVAGGSSSEQQFSCTVASHAQGELAGSVKMADGTLLQRFSVMVGAPSVTEVMPAQAVIGERTTFSVKGENLPKKLSLFVGFCSNMRSLEGGTSNERQFECLFAPGGAGTQEGRVQGTNDSILFEFAVEALVPSVTEVVPTQAVIGERTVFTVKGEHLSDGFGFFLGFCADVEQLPDGSDTQQQFECLFAPGGAGAVADGQVFNAQNQPIYAFNITAIETLAPAVDLAQCASFVPPTTIVVPCLDVAGDTYQFEMDLLPSEPDEPLRLALDMASLQPVELSAGEYCASFDGASLGVRVNCLDLGALHWADLQLVPVDETFQLELLDFGVR